jgi:hypothetical protein
MPDKKPTQTTALGHEIPIPKRTTFLRDLKRVSKDADPEAVLKRAETKRKPKPPS